MKLQGAEKGRVRLVSEPLEVLVLEDNGVRTVKAVFIFIPPRIEHMCQALADFYNRRLLDRTPDPDLVMETKRLLMVSWGLRVDDGGYTQHVFAFPSVLREDGITLLEKDDDLYTRIRDAEVHLRCAHGADLWVDYFTFKRNEMPLIASDKQMEDLLEDAKKKSLPTLLFQHGYWKLARLMRGLAAQLPGGSDLGNGSAG